MKFVILAVITIAFGSGFSVFLLFDSLVRLQYKDYKSSWEADGKPNCYLWRIEGFSWKRQFHTGRCFSEWIRHTPGWINENSRALKLLSWLRFSYYIFLCCWLILVVFAVRDYWIKRQAIVSQ